MLHALLAELLALQSREELVKASAVIVSSVGSSSSLKDYAVTVINKLINLVSCI